MAKKSSKSVEKLRADVQALSEAVWALKAHVRVETAAESAAQDRRKRGSAKMASLDAQVKQGDVAGLVSTWGTMRLPGANGTEHQVRWEQESIPATSLIPSDSDAAATILAAIGHRLRLAILGHLLCQRASVSDLVSSLELDTTGAAYHHLNVLQGAGLVIQRERAIFEIAPDQVACIVGILAALATEPIVEEPTRPQPPGGEAPTDG